MLAIVSIIRMTQLEALVALNREGGTAVESSPADPPPLQVRILDQFRLLPRELSGRFQVEYVRRVLCKGMVQSYCLRAFVPELPHQPQG